MSAEWFIRVQGEKLGPLTMEQLQELARNGRLAPDTLLRRGEHGNTMAADAVEELAGIFGAAASPPVLSRHARSFVAPGRLGRGLVGLLILCSPPRS